jgi:hypothetical protein
VSRLERNKIGAAAQPQTSALAGNADEAYARMAREAPGAPDMVPLFLAGTVQAGAVSQVRLICRDTSDGRVRRSLRVRGRDGVSARHGRG